VKNSKLSVAFLPLLTIFILSAIDAIATAVGITYGFYDELNPLMDIALEHSVAAFIAAKLSLVTLSCVLLYRLWHKKLARYAAYILIGLYIFIVTIHTIAYIAIYNAGMLS